MLSRHNHGQKFQILNLIGSLHLKFQPTHDLGRHESNCLLVIAAGRRARPGLGPVARPPGPCHGLVAAAAWQCLSHKSTEHAEAGHRLGLRLSSS